MDTGLAFASLAHQVALMAGSAAGFVSPTLWYLTRATAVAAYVVLALSALLGMLRPVARNAGERLSWVSDEFHQTLAALFGVLVVLHLITLYFHTYIPFTLSNLLLVGSQPYRPLPVNLGVLALYTMVALLLSSWLRRFIPYRFWRWIHSLAFVTLVLVTFHGLLAGSDAGEPWMRALYVGVSCALGFIVVMRLLTRRRAARKSQEAAEAFEEGEAFEEVSEQF